jgi:hypothetical protein
MGYHYSSGGIMLWQVDAGAEEAFIKRASYGEAESRDNPLYLYRLYRGLTVDISFCMLSANGKVTRPDFLIGLYNVKDRDNTYKVEHEVFCSNDMTAFRRIRIIIQGTSLWYAEEDEGEERNQERYKDSVKRANLYNSKVYHEPKFYIYEMPSVGPWSLVREGTPEVVEEGNTEMDGAYVMLRFSPEHDRKVLIDYVRFYWAPLVPKNEESGTVYIAQYSSLEV